VESDEAVLNKVHKKIQKIILLKQNVVIAFTIRKYEWQANISGGR
jgi:hypothetical protein